MAVVFWAAVITGLLLSASDGSTGALGSLGPQRQTGDRGSGNASPGNAAPGDTALGDTAPGDIGTSAPLGQGFQVERSSGLSSGSLCPDGTHHHGERCFWMASIKDGATWYDAQAHCEDEDGALADIRSEQELQFLMKAVHYAHFEVGMLSSLNILDLARPSEDTSVWLGLSTRLCGDGGYCWKWTDVADATAYDAPSQVFMPQWQEHDGNSFPGECASLNKNGKLHHEDCMDIHEAFLCVKTPREGTTTVEYIDLDEEGKSPVEVGKSFVDFALGWWYSSEPEPEAAEAVSTTKDTTTLLPDTTTTTTVPATTSTPAATTPEKVVPTTPTPTPTSSTAATPTPEKEIVTNNIASTTIITTTVGTSSTEPSTVTATTPRTSTPTPTTTTPRTSTPTPIQEPKTEPSKAPEHAGPSTTHKSVILTTLLVPFEIEELSEVRPPNPADSESNHATDPPPVYHVFEVTAAPSTPAVRTSTGQTRPPFLRDLQQEDTNRKDIVPQVAPGIQDYVPATNLIPGEPTQDPHEMDDVGTPVMYITVALVSTVVAIAVVVGLYARKKCIKVKVSRAQNFSRNNMRYQAVRRKHDLESLDSKADLLQASPVLPHKEADAKGPGEGNKTYRTGNPAIQNPAFQQ